jgi:endonuclease YncB( thermonuclease family)
MEYIYDLEKVIHLVDGDTFDAVLSKDIGFYVRGQAAIRLRLQGVDTPERGKEGYTAARVFTGAWLMANAGNIKVESLEKDSFGRWISKVYVADTGVTLSEELKAAGLIKPGSIWNL